MSQLGFAIRDQLPLLPSTLDGLVQVKYNGMLTVIMWDEQRQGFVGWSPRGRCYFSLNDTKQHPVTEYFNTQFRDLKTLAFIGETYVVREIDGINYMTEFNRSMSIIKNPKSDSDVSRIRLAIFDYAYRKEDGFAFLESRHIDRFTQLKRQFAFPQGTDRNVVHLPDAVTVERSFDESRNEIQDFWNTFIGERGFEGLVLHASNGEQYKIKFRDTVDTAIIAFRITGNDRLSCNRCGVKFDAIWLRKLAKEGRVLWSDWFDQDGRLLKGEGGPWVRDEKMILCPLCGASLSAGPGPILGAKIALMNPEGYFVDIADGAQFSPISPILDLIEPLYEENGYLWVKPEVVVEVAYQQLYVNRPRPVYTYGDGRYIRAGTMNAVSLRPYKPTLREDKTVNPQDLRLDQVNFFVNKVKRIQEKWQTQMRL